MNFYQLVKIKKDKSEEVVLETSASSVEKAMDWFYHQKPKAYYSSKYKISINRNKFPLFETEQFTD